MRPLRRRRRAGRVGATFVLTSLEATPSLGGKPKWSEDGRAPRRCDGSAASASLYTHHLPPPSSLPLMSHLGPSIYLFVRLSLSSRAAAGKPNELCSAPPPEPSERTDPKRSRSEPALSLSSVCLSAVQLCCVRESGGTVCARPVRSVHRNLCNRLSCGASVCRCLGLILSG